MCTKKKDIITKSFRDNGISILLDGSEDELIYIKEISNNTINWNDWENAIDITIGSNDFEAIPNFKDDGMAFEVWIEDLIRFSYELFKVEKLKDFYK